MSWEYDSQGDWTRHRHDVGQKIRDYVESELDSRDDCEEDECCSTDEEEEEND